MTNMRFSQGLNCIEISDKMEHSIHVLFVFHHSTSTNFVLKAKRIRAKDKLQTRGTWRHEPNSPIMTRAGTAFHSNQKVMKDEVTKMIPGIKTVVK